MKRSFDDELERSPSAKRAKRVRNNKKRRIKSEQEENGYIEQQDWITFDTGPATSSPASWKQSPVKPPTPFPLRLAHKNQTPNSTNKTYEEFKTKDEQKGLKSAKNSSEKTMQHLKDQESPKTEATTRKTRVETEPTGEIKYPIDNGDFKIPAIAGPSKQMTETRITAEDFALDSSPSSDIAAPVDYTFRAFPNPVSAPFTLPKPQSTTEKHDSTDDEKPAPETQLPITLPAGAVPAGTKILKAINKHLKALEAKLTGPADTEADTKNELHSLRTDVAHLCARLDCAELRAAVRHEMLFNALIKVSTDVCALRAGEQDVLEQQQQQQQQQQQHVDGHGHGHGQQQDGGEDGAENESLRGGVGSPRKAMVGAAEAKSRRMAGLKQSRKTLEQCLRSFNEDMNRAEDEEQVRRYGGLCVQYAGDLFKTLG